MFDISKLKFDDKGLIPAIVVDDESGEVLTLAYMNEESLKISLEKKLTCFWSRSRQELWLKGETSGNYQHIVSITADCDMDALTVRVRKDGPACHTGENSCFFNTVMENDEIAPAFSVDGLVEMLQGRKTNPKEGSYTTYLFEKGKANDKAETIYEISDLMYHVLVLMIEMGISVDDIKKELASRHVIDHKVKQEKMTK